ncbi:MAG TPA: ATP-binding protein [Woeseiaceae bacterium]|nr:ATP-binding protein [Woeseiaceae bacterium]
MSLKNQLLLVSLLALLLPWAGCQFVRETESALRASQQQMLAGTARAIADSLSQYPEAFPPRPVAADAEGVVAEQLYAHALESSPVIDGYLEDWPLGESSLRALEANGVRARFALGQRGSYYYLFVAVADDTVTWATPASVAPGDSPPYADRVSLATVTPPYAPERISFAAEAPGAVVPYVENAFGFAADRPREAEPEMTIRAVWQDVPGGYQLEARIPRARLGSHLGLTVDDAAGPQSPGARAATFTAPRPPPLAGHREELATVAASLLQPGLRLVVTDAAGWRIAAAGSLDSAAGARPGGVSRWLRFAYDAVVEDGTPTDFAEPDPTGREQQAYVTAALTGEPGSNWFRSLEGEQAIVAVSQPVARGDDVLGVVILQQGTDAILSLTNRGLVRLLNLTLLAMLLVAGGLLGYATWLSRRIRRLSVAAAGAADERRLATALPSAGAGDEIGDLSRSFSSVLAQLGSYNDYLRTLASKLSHELRTPLAIVTSSLENLEQEALDATARSYTARARDGAERLRRILAAMSEANRVEELMSHVETEPFPLDAAVRSAVGGYRDVYPERHFELAVTPGPGCIVHGAPELAIQMLDKLVENAVSFSRAGDTIGIDVARDGAAVRLDVRNPGPPLPTDMHGRLFDSLVSVRPRDDGTHLGLGLYVARLIATGHNGRIEARDIDGGVVFSVWLPAAEARDGNGDGKPRDGGPGRRRAGGARGRTGG